MEKIVYSFVCLFLFFSQTMAQKNKSNIEVESPITFYEKDKVKLLYYKDLKSFDDSSFYEQEKDLIDFFYREFLKEEELTFRYMKVIKIKNTKKRVSGVVQTAKELESQYIVMTQIISQLEIRAKIFKEKEKVRFANSNELSYYNFTFISRKLEDHLKFYNSYKGLKDSLGNYFYNSNKELLELYEKMIKKEEEYIAGYRQYSSSGKMTEKELEKVLFYIKKLKEDVYKIDSNLLLLLIQAEQKFKKK